MATATQIQSHTVEFALAKETKGTYVYTATSEDAVVSTIYVRKEGYPNGPPAALVVHIGA